MARADARRAREDDGALVASVRVGRENKLTINTDAGFPIHQMPSPANPKAHRTLTARLCHVAISASSGRVEPGSKRAANV
jgi:cysteine synthase